jgi:hypothetical protein
VRFCHKSPVAHAVFSTTGPKHPPRHGLRRLLAARATAGKIWDTLTSRRLLPSLLTPSPPRPTAAMSPRASALAALLALALCTSAAVPPTSPLHPSLRLVELSGGGGTQKACATAAEKETAELLRTAVSCLADSTADCESACIGELAGTDFDKTALICSLGPGRKCCVRSLLPDDSTVNAQVVVLMPYTAGGRNGDGVCAGVEPDSACAECAYAVVKNVELKCSAVDVPPVTENYVGPIECSEKAVAFDATVAAGAADRRGGGRNDSSGSTFPVAAAVGGGVGGLAVLAIAAAALAWCCCYRNRKKSEEEMTGSVPAAGYPRPPMSGTTNFSSADADALLEAASTSHHGDEPPIDLGAANYGQPGAQPQYEQPQQYPQYPPRGHDPMPPVPQGNQWQDGPSMLGTAPPPPRTPLTPLTQLPPPPPPPPQNIGSYPVSSNPYGSVVHNL